MDHSIDFYLDHEDTEDNFNVYSFNKSREDMRYLIQTYNQHLEEAIVRRKFINLVHGSDLLDVIVTHKMTRESFEK